MGRWKTWTLGGLLCVGAVVAGCGSVVVQPGLPDDAGSGEVDRPVAVDTGPGPSPIDTGPIPVDVGIEPIDAGRPTPGACQLPFGGFCPDGQTCPMGDGCNTCFCSEGRATCTRINCVDAGTPTRDTGNPIRDTGVPSRDVPSPTPACVLPGGGRCLPGETCQVDRCTVCQCSRLGELSCRTSPTCPSVDAGQPFCRLPNGDACMLGTTCRIDRCTACTCSINGALVCNRDPACGVDAGVDAGPQSCRLPNGGVCPPFGRCEIDRCTVCYCDGSGNLACSVSPNCGVDAGVDSGVTACASNDDCRGGQLCDGPQGCGVRWTCVAGRTCARDLATYCGCDGRVFQASSTCAGRPYANRGNCGIVGNDAGSPNCAAQNASGDGLCDAFFGYAWNGRACVGISGCRCVGSDCGSLSRDIAVCQARFANACR